MGWPNWRELIWDNQITHKELVGLGWPTWRKLDRTDLTLSEFWYGLSVISWLRIDYINSCCGFAYLDEVDLGWPAWS